MFTLLQRPEPQHRADQPRIVSKRRARSKQRFILTSEMVLAELARVKEAILELGSSSAQLQIGFRGVNAILS